MTENCLFCRIGREEIPADIVGATDTAIAFRDINPAAPIHFLVIPRRHIASLAGEEDDAELGRLMALATRVARDLGVAESGFRTVINTGDDGGQTVQHLHIHVLGGRRMAWPPG